MVRAILDICGKGKTSVYGAKVTKNMDWLQRDQLQYDLPMSGMFCIASMPTLPHTFNLLHLKSQADKIGLVM